MTRNSILGYYPYTLFRTLPPRLENHLSILGKLLFGTSEVVWDPENTSSVHKEGA